MTAPQGTGPVSGRAPALTPATASNAPSLGVREPGEAPSPADGHTEPHVVTCRDCGRRLRSAWAARGIGPVCDRKNRRPAAHIPAPRPEHHIDGQEELPLVHLQPTLWSL